MSKVPYRDIPKKLRNREPFVGNSMSARFDKEGRYAVYSYNTQIAGTGGHDNKAVWINPQKYSRTTSRHQNLCEANL